jgi:hypothetical protein
MGLDAIVFRNVTRLKELFGTDSFDVDDATGEATIKPGTQVAVPQEEYIAHQARLGNAAEIGELQRVVTEALGNESLIAQRILYSGSHSGDSIGLDVVPELRRELAH